MTRITRKRLSVNYTPGSGGAIERALKQIGLDEPSGENVRELLLAGIAARGAGLTHVCLPDGRIALAQLVSKNALLGTVIELPAAQIATGVSGQQVTAEASRAPSLPPKLTSAKEPRVGDGRARAPSAPSVNEEVVGKPVEPSAVSKSATVNVSGVPADIRPVSVRNGVEKSSQGRRGSVDPLVQCQVRDSGAEANEEPELDALTKSLLAAALDF